MNFIETRGNDGEYPLQVSFSQAILAPIASYGGIYVPEKLPELGDSFYRNMLILPIKHWLKPFWMPLKLI